MAKHWIPLPSIRTVLIVIVVVVYTVTLTSLLFSIFGGEGPLRLPTFGNIIAVGYEAYGGDIVISAGNSTIDWGTVYVGTSTNRSFILKSKSVATTKPQLKTTGWVYTNQQNQSIVPPSVGEITVNWTINDAILVPNQEINVTITLTVRDDATFVDYLIDNYIRTFSFDMIIEPSSVE